MNTVEPDGSSKYTTISSAIRDAKQGDRVLVQPGDYFESITIEKNIDIQGEGPPGAVSLTGVPSGAQHCVGHCVGPTALVQISPKGFVFGGPPMD